jgi:hypothetical protein
MEQWSGAALGWRVPFAALSHHPSGPAPNPARGVMLGLGSLGPSCMGSRLRCHVGAGVGGLLLASARLDSVHKAETQPRTQRPPSARRLESVQPAPRPVIAVGHATSPDPWRFCGLHA